jgi:nitroreductase
MDVTQTVATRRSIRKFDPDRRVGDEDLATIVEAGRLAPSWKNDQPWRFVVVRSPETLNALADCLPEGNGAHRTIRAASAAIVLIGVPGEGAVHQGKEFWLVDCGIAGENIHLQATALGIATVWVSLLDSAGVCGVLGMPEGMECVGIFPLGYATPDIADRPRVPRRPAEEVVFAERFGQPFTAGA